MRTTRPAYLFMPGTVRTLLPGTSRMNLATEAELDVDTLAERLRAEAVSAGAYFIPCFLAGATGRRKATD